MRNRKPCEITLAPVFLVILLGAVHLAAGQSVCNGDQLFTAAGCAGDSTSPSEHALFQLVNKYRAANGRSELHLSTSLSLLANRRVLDMRLNMKTLTHSWSNCPYDIKDQKTWPCMMDSPQRLKTGYKGQGYETLYRTTAGQADPTLAMQAWGKSTVHNSIILSLGAFGNLAWDEVGVAVDGQFAVLWFGSPGTSKGVTGVETGIGVSYDRAVAGLSKIFSITQQSSAVGAGKWQGFSANKKIRLEIFGNRQDISEASIAISMKLEAGKLDAPGQNAVSTLLMNLFPEWTDRDEWIANAVTGLALNRAASKTRIIRNIAVEMSSNAPGTLRLLVGRESRRKYVEVF